MEPTAQLYLARCSFEIGFPLVVVPLVGLGFPALCFRKSASEPTLSGGGGAA